MADRDVRLWGHLKNKVFIFPTAVYIAFNSPALQAELEQTVSLSLLSESFLLHFPAPVALFCPRGHSSLALDAACSFPHSMGLPHVGQGSGLRKELQTLWTTALGGFCLGFVWIWAGLAVGLTPPPMPFEA